MLRLWVGSRRFTVAEGVNGQNLVKTSVQRGIRGAVSVSRRVFSLGFARRCYVVHFSAACRAVHTE